MKRIHALSLVAALLAVTFPVHADDTAAAVARWDASWAALKDCYNGCHSVIKKGGKVEDRTYRVWFKKPMNLRSEVVKGNRSGDNGSVAVWTGGDRVTGHQGGILAGISLSLTLDNPKATSIRGGTIRDLQFGRMLEVIHMWLNAKAKTTLTSGTVGGHAATIITFTSDNKDFIAGNNNIAKDQFAYDNQVNLPLQWQSWEPDGTQAVDSSYYDIKVDIGVPDSAFQVKTRMTPP
ncbi:MAG TPA: hypothetical protein VGO93_19070 [Candidatus Xenobia bacterium]|jgi:outer membrane lipoprotein-sorting protein